MFDINIRQKQYFLFFSFIEITRRDMHDWLNKTLIQEKDVLFFDLIFLLKIYFL